MLPLLPMLEAERNISDYRNWLLDELCTRKETNPSYSLRAFAKYLKVNPATLSQVFSGKRGFSKKNALKVASKFSLSPVETKKLLSSIRKETLGKEEDTSYNEVLQLENDRFKAISDWYHYGILSLAKLKNNEASPAWIAEQLNISIPEAKVAMERLKRLKYLTIENGKLVRAIQKPLSIISEIPSPAIRKYHKQNLKLAEKAIEEVSMQERELSAMTMAIDPKKMNEAAKMITKFKRKFLRHMESGKQERVYTLSIQFFPLSKTNGGKDNENTK